MEPLLGAKRAALLGTTYVEDRVLQRRGGGVVSRRLRTE